MPTDTSGVVRIRLIIGDRVPTATLDDTADTGLDMIAAAGGDFQMTIEPLD